MAVNKVIYNGTTLIDLTGDTVTASCILSGYTAHDKSGTKIKGTYNPNWTYDYILEQGFDYGNSTYVDDGSTITVTNDKNGHTLTKQITDSKVTTTVKDKNGTTKGTFVKTYNDDCSVITSVNNYTGYTTTKTFDYNNQTVTIVTKNKSGTVVRSTTKKLI